MTAHYLEVIFIIYQCVKERKSVTADAGTLLTPHVNILFYKYYLLRVIRPGACKCFIYVFIFATTKQINNLKV